MLAMTFDPKLLHTFLFKAEESSHWKVDVLNLSSSELLLSHSAAFWGIYDLPQYLYGQIWYVG